MKRFTTTPPAWLIGPVLCLLAFALAALPALPAHAKSPHPYYAPSDPGTAASQQPRLDLTASSDQVLHNHAVTLMWDVFNAKGCQAGGDWQGARRNRGHETVAGLTQDSLFTLSCKSHLGVLSTKVLVKVIEQDDVTVSLTSSAETVNPGSSIVLQWNAEHASQCNASGDWLGPLATKGTQTISGIDSDRTFSLSCGTGTSSALASVTVNVRSDTPKLEWIAPTEDVEGNPLLNLAGYRVYWGTESGNYTDSATIEDPSATEWELLMPAGSYYFAMSALSAKGEQSELSNEVIKTIGSDTNEVATTSAAPVPQTQPAPPKSLLSTDTAQPEPSYATLSRQFLQLIGSDAQIYQTLTASHDAGVCSLDHVDLEYPVALAGVRLARHSALVTDRSSYHLGRYARR